MSKIDTTTISKLLPYLTPEERIELQQLLNSDNAVWSPLPGPQFDAYYSDVDVLGYGGAAGGGKTDLAIGKALTQHKRTQFFRRHGTELGAIIDRVKGVTNDYSRGPDRYGMWRDVVPGRAIEFGSFPNLGDEHKYQGRAKDLLVLDEATNMLEAQARYVMGWVRTEDPSQKTQVLITFNPPEDEEGLWVVRYFAPWLDENYPNPAAFGEVRWMATVSDGERTEEIERPNGEPFMHNGELVRPESRTFILSKVTDNPYYAATDYVRRLQAMPEPHRSRLLYANFKAALQDNAMQVIPTAWIEAAMKRWKPRMPVPEMTGAGMDVARGGADDTTLARRHGNWFDKPLVWRGKETPDGATAAGVALPYLRDATPIHIELPGAGESAYDHMKMVYSGPTMAINVGAGATAPDKNELFTFANRRSELVWRMREALDPMSNLGIELPPDDRLKRELTSYRWRLQGRMVYVESREEIIKRIGNSPDVATAYILALIDTPKYHQLEAEYLKHGAPTGRPRPKVPSGQGHNPYALKRRH